MKTKSKRLSTKAVEQSLFDPFKEISEEKVVALKGFRKRLQKKRRTPSKGLLSPEEDDFRHRFVDRPDESRAWTRQRLG